MRSREGARGPWRAMLYAYMRGLVEGPLLQLGACMICSWLRVLRTFEVRKLGPWCVVP